MNYYLFDTNPEMIKILKDKFLDKANVHIFGFGLGDANISESIILLPWAKAGASFRNRKFRFNY